MNQVEKRLGTEPASRWCAYSLVGECCVFLVDLDGLTTATCSSRISEKLRFAALLEADEPNDGELSS